jgi:hypothetical protein
MLGRSGFGGVDDLLVALVDPFECSFGLSFGDDLRELWSR